MGINLGEGITTSSTGVLNLEKNAVLDLTKRNPGLTLVNLGAGWDVAAGGDDFDLDIAAILLDANGKFGSSENIVYFNHMETAGVKLNGDNLTGAGDGDDEVISLDLSKINPNVQKIVFVVTIYRGQEKRQTFGMINNSYVRLLDVAHGEKELCRFDLKENGSTATGVIFAELTRDGAEWQFKAIGEGKVADLNMMVNLYA